MSARGYFGVGIVGSKSEVNVGTLWRSASALGAAFVFTAGRRYPRQASDTAETWRHVPYLEFPSAEALFDAMPRGCVPVAVEIDERAVTLPGFRHPERACYILGAEDNGLPRRVLDRVPSVVSIPSNVCLNVAVAGSIVIYDRVVKKARGA